MWRIRIRSTCVIAGCPESGIEAIDFRRRHKILEAPHNKWEVDIDMVSESLVRECGGGNNNADIIANNEYNYEWSPGSLSWCMRRGDPGSKRYAPTCLHSLPPSEIASGACEIVRAIYRQREADIESHVAWRKNLEERDADELFARDHPALDGRGNLVVDRPSFVNVNDTRWDAAVERDRAYLEQLRIQRLEERAKEGADCCNALGELISSVPRDVLRECLVAIAVTDHQVAATCERIVDAARGTTAHAILDAILDDIREGV